MSAASLIWHGYRYFPYEREFAKREVEAILGHAPREVEHGLEIPLNGAGVSCFKRLTYFSEVILPDGKRLVTDQARLEASARRNGALKKSSSTEHVSSGRQSTRYSAHGLHEYKGKFNPQVVRAIGNILGLPRGAWILDPFCGSGTTLLESAHAGWNAVGVDLNPLAVLISNAKVRAIGAPIDELKHITNQLTSTLSQRTANLSYERAWTKPEMIRVAGDRWRDTLLNADYLALWFPESVLVQIAAILHEINSCMGDSLKLIFRVILSDLARDVSLQDPGDLRMRRRKDPQQNYPLVPMFLKSTEAKIAIIIKARETLGRTSGYQQAVVGDNREPLNWLQDRPELKPLRGFDAAITSPPYATALPYIDTQRLSLCLLGLIQAGDVMKLEREMTGTREINESKRKELEAELQTTPNPRIPQSVTNLCLRMLGLASHSSNGFRRRNMPALVYRYFSEMTHVFENVHALMRPSGVFALVVGRNRTALGGEAILIDTPQMLADIAEATGWRLQTLMELDTYQRFDIHQRNSINAECLLLLERA